MKKNSYFLILSFLFLQSCSFLEQNRFIETKVISNSLNEQIIYKYYQTGLNDYKVDFYSVSESDSVKLFEHFVNDALFSASTYRISEHENEITIRTKLFAKEKKLITRNGKSIIMTNR